MTVRGARLSTFIASGLAMMLGVPSPAWSQTPDATLSVKSAYVTIFPAGSTEVDFILALQRGIEIVLCQSGIRPRYEGPAVPSELRLVASLTKADFESDRQAGEIVRDCELEKASATLPGGANVPLPDLALSSRSPLARNRDGRRASESFFVACGANFARSALDTLKDKVTVRPSSCEEQPQPKPKRKK